MHPREFTLFSTPTGAMSDAKDDTMINDQKEYAATSDGETVSSSNEPNHHDDDDTKSPTTNQRHYNKNNKNNNEDPNVNFESSMKRSYRKKTPRNWSYVALTIVIVPHGHGRGPSRWSNSCMTKYDV
jgi:hypothetical protein